MGFISTLRLFDVPRNYLGSAGAQFANENFFNKVLRPVLVELIGTFLLITLGLWGGCNTQGNLLQGALCAGFTLMALLASFGHISGTHLNPCVTIGVFIVGEIRLHLAFVYVIVQIIGGIAAAGMLRLIVARETYDKCDGGATLLGGEIMMKWWQGLIMEFFITFLLVTVILLVALDSESKTAFASLLIGFTLIGNILVAGEHTGASMNPARSLGPAIIARKWKYHWIYWLGPILGALAAGLMYRLLWASHDRRWPKLKQTDMASLE